MLYSQVEFYYFPIFYKLIKLKKLVRFNGEEATLLVVNKKAGSDTILLVKYVKEKNRQDHLAHCRNYNEIALPIVVSTVDSQDIESIL